MTLEKENKDRIIRDIERTFPNKKIARFWGPPIKRTNIRKIL